MPFIQIHVSQPVPPVPDTRRAVVERATELTAEHLAKPTSYVMTQLVEGSTLVFAGSDEPAACVDVRVIGTPSPSQTANLTRALSDMLQEQLGVSPARTFVIFTPVPRELWGLDGRMLA